MAEAFWRHKRQSASLIIHSEILIRDFNHRSKVRDLRSIFVIGVGAVFLCGEQNVIGLYIPIRHFYHCV